MSEEWRPVPGYGGHYEASSLGQIRVKPRTIIKKHSRTGKLAEFSYPGRILLQCDNGYGYPRVTLGVEGKTISVDVHRMVAKAFYGEPAKGLVVCHNNGVKTDNRPENLRWDTQKANNDDRRKHKTLPVGENHPMAKLKQADIDSIRSRGLHYTEVMRECGMSRTQSHRITTGRSWV
jgi:hypothetical protein